MVKNLLQCTSRLLQVALVQLKLRYKNSTVGALLFALLPYILITCILLYLVPGTAAPITGSRGLIADARRPITKTHGRPITRDLGLVHSTGRAADNTPPSLEVRGRWLVSRIVTEDWVRFREN